MKKLFVLVASVLLIMLQSGCKKINGKGDVVTENRSLSGYTAIDLSMSENVYYTQDSVYSLVLEGQQNVLDVIETVIENHSLVLKIKEHYTLGSHDPVKVTVHAPDVSHVSINGSGTFRVNSSWKGGTLGAGISGSGDIYLSELRAGTFNGDISGSGSIHGSTGVADYLHLNISGSGNLDFRELEADTVYATISGSGSIKVWAVKMLDGTISGSGSIYYRGSPAVYSHISGSGSISPL
jgi:hypothetical protein